ncbi:MAG: hypothetical protein JWN72_2550 [Thermoleophilia bacterium]|nr:hypothetical protein [Thermoleophilia bacterium]
MSSHHRSTANPIRQALRVLINPDVVEGSGPPAPRSARYRAAQHDGVVPFATRATTSPNDTEIDAGAFTQSSALYGNAFRSA